MKKGHSVAFSFSIHFIHFGIQHSAFHYTLCAAVLTSGALFEESGRDFRWHGGCSKTRRQDAVAILAAAPALLSGQPPHPYVPPLAAGRVFNDLPALPSHTVFERAIARA
jgi:hypothetical protein